MRRLVQLNSLIYALFIVLCAACDDAAIPVSTPLPDQGEPDQSAPLPDFQRPDPDASADMSIEADLGSGDNTCTDGTDCVSGYCVPGPDGQRV